MGPRVKASVFADASFPAASLSICMMSELGFSVFVIPAAARSPVIVSCDINDFFVCDLSICIDVL